MDTEIVRARARNSEREHILWVTQVMETFVKLFVDTCHTSVDCVHARTTRSCVGACGELTFHSHGYTCSFFLNVNYCSPSVQRSTFLSHIHWTVTAHQECVILKFLDSIHDLCLCLLSAVLFTSSFPTQCTDHYDYSRLLSFLPWVCWCWYRLSCSCYLSSCLLVVDMMMVLQWARLRSAGKLHVLSVPATHAIQIKVRRVKNVKPTHSVEYHIGIEYAYSNRVPWCSPIYHTLEYSNHSCFFHIQPIDKWSGSPVCSVPVECIIIIIKEYIINGE